MAKIYTVLKGDLLYKISIRFYKNASRWREIVNANPQLTGRKSAIDGSPLIFPGDILIIPDITQPTIPESINAENDDELSIIINGQKFTTFTNYTLMRNIGSFDTFSFSSPFDPDDQIQREYFRPFSYQDCQVYYGGELFFNGTLLAPQPQSSPSSRNITITGYPKCALINDVMIPISKFPIEFNNQNLQTIANEICNCFGIQTVFEDSPGNIFEKVTPEPQTNCLSFLVELAQQRGLLISNDVNGNLLFWKSKSGNTVASLQEGETPFISCVPNFNPQKFFSHITGITKTTKKSKSEKFTYENKYLINKGIIRPYNYIIRDAEKQDLQSSVLSKAGRMIADSCSYRLTVQGHRNLQKNIWNKNTLISVVSKGGMIYKDTVLLIKSVTIEKTSEKGSTTILDLVFPGSFSGEIPEVFAWEG